MIKYPLTPMASFMRQVKVHYVPKPVKEFAGVLGYGVKNSYNYNSMMFNNSQARMKQYQMVSKMYQMQNLNNYNNHVRNQVLKKKRGGKRSSAWAGHGTKSFYSEFAYPAYTKSG